MPQNSSISRVLIIGIDGGTWTVLRPAIDRGYMPFVKSLMDAGSSGILTSTIPALTPPAWAAFQTGMNPGKTGVFSFTMLDRAHNRINVVSSALLGHTIWDIAGAAGKKVAVINVPMTYPPRKVNGCMVTGLLTPSMDSDFTWPPQLKAELLKAVPDYQLFKVEVDSDSPAYKEMKAFVAGMADTVKSRAKGAEYLIARESPDLCMVHFQASDLIQHALWCYLDASGRQYDAASHDYILREFYGTLDRAIQDTHRAFAAIGGDVVTFIVSDHGFEAHRRRFNLGTWLHEQGFLQRDAAVIKPPLRKRISRALRIGSLLRLFMSNDAVQKLETTFKVVPQAVNWQTSRTYAIGFCSEGGIYLLETDSAARSRTMAQIVDGLKALRDPATGKPFIDAIHRKEDIYHGPRMDLMPDLIVVPSSGYTCTGFCFPDVPIVDEVNPDKELHIGKHHADGVVVISGDGVIGRAGLRSSLLDIAPTVLYALGVDVPEDCDGQVISDIFSGDFLSAHGSPRRSASADERPVSSPADVYSPQDQEKIQKRLRDLGYM